MSTKKDVRGLLSTPQEDVRQDPDGGRSNSDIDDPTLQPGDAEADYHIAQPLLDSPFDWMKRPPK